MPDGATMPPPPMAGLDSLAAMPSQQAAEAIEQQILDGFLQQPIADQIRRAYSYLNTNSQQYTALLNCAPIVAQAAQLYGRGDFVNAFSLIYYAYRAIALLRLSNPGMPAI